MIHGFTSIVLQSIRPFAQTGQTTTGIVKPRTASRRRKRVRAEKNGSNSRSASST
jgi:hypothetical protein